ncbi:MAG: phosphoribosylanthranilate isomerase [Alphaproteobacteria bacterium]
MQKIKTKICGITTKETLNACVDGGADYVGFVFYAPSPRNISPEDAADLADNMPERVKRVVLIVDATDAEISKICSALNPDFIQCHGDESPERVREIKEKFSVPIIKAINVKTASDLNKFKAYEESADMFLFDAKNREGDLPGGEGISFDWGIMKNFTCSKPWMLAGGLRKENIAMAIRKTGVKIIDLSSGVESTRGVKSPTKITELLTSIQKL